MYSDPGYLSLYCFLGLHIYTANTCIHCDRHEPTPVEYKPVTD